MSVRTPSQTIGPFFHVGLKWDAGDKVPFAGQGERITLTGRIYDGVGAPIADALLESWQADASGAAPGEGDALRACGAGRVATDAEGRYRLETAMPGASRGAGGETYVPQISITIFARGLLKAVRTRVLLASAAEAQSDPLARAAGARAGTLIARRDSADASLWHWDVRLQGAQETAFIAL